MKLGMITNFWAFAGMSMEESLERVAALGFKYVDLYGRDHGDPRSVGEAEWGRVRTKLEELGLKASDFLSITAGKGVVGNPGSSDPEEYGKCIEYMTKSIDFARTTGCKHALILGGIVAEGLSREDSWANAIRFLKEVAAYAEEQGVYLALESLQDEDVPVNLVRTIDDMVRMIEDVDSPFLLANIDLGHVFLRTCNHAPDELKKLANKVIHVHITDNDGLFDSNSMLDGRGDAPIRRYLEQLREYGIEEAAKRCGDEAVAAIEVGRPGDELVTGLGDGSLDPDELAKTCRDYLLKEVPFLELE
jgi:sugar phosphate isomerase/epimerase